MNTAREPLRDPAPVPLTASAEAGEQAARPIGPANVVDIGRRGPGRHAADLPTLVAQIEADAAAAAQAARQQAELHADARVAAAEARTRALLEALAASQTALQERLTELRTGGAAAAEPAEVDALTDPLTDPSPSAGGPRLFEFRRRAVASPPAETSPPPLQDEAEPAALQPAPEPEPQPPPQPEPTDVPVIAAVPRFRQSVSLRTRGGTAYLSLLFALAATVAAVIALVTAADGNLRSTVGIGASLATVALALLALVPKSQSVKMQIRNGVLEVESAEAARSYDLADPAVTVEMASAPGRKGWRITFAGPASEPFAVDAKVIDPVSFTRTIRRWRPEI